MNEPVPVRRALLGCLALALIGMAAVVLVRPAIFLFAPPRDDTAVVLGTTNMVAEGPVERQVVLARSYGWDGEIDAGGGRVQLNLVVAPARFGGIAVLAAASPVREDCAITPRVDRLLDCDGRAWSLEGDPLDLAYPPLDRFGVTVDRGTVVADLTRPFER